MTCFKSSGAVYRPVERRVEGRAGEAVVFLFYIYCLIVQFAMA
jgi:hypothetical protein